MERQFREPINIKNYLMGLIMLLVFLLPSSVWAKADLTKIRVGQSPQKTRVVFEIKHNQGFKITKLSHPNRVVVDFKKATNQVNFKQLKLLDNHVKTIRVTRNQHRTRVVLDLRKGLDYHYFILRKNKQGVERVVVDVLAKSNHAIKQVHKKTIHVAKKRKVIKPHAKIVKRSTKVATIAHHTYLKAAKKSMLSYQHPNLIIAIDPGHGGKDTGAIGPHHIYEKTVTLAMAKKLKRMIDRQPGMRAVLTRTKDVFIHLNKRVQIAHRNDADIFMSIHANSYPNKSVRGGTVYILSTHGASSAMARIIAKSENASLPNVKRKDRSKMAFALSDLTREANIRASHKLAKDILGEIGKTERLHNKAVQSADFAVLKSIDMPSLLIETAFISNPTDEKKLTTNHFQKRMASSIVAGLDKFVRHHAKQPRWGERLYVHYKVKNGDTLSEIASNFDITTNRLKKINRIHNTNNLYVGKKLRIPLSEKMVAGL